MPMERIASEHPLDLDELEREEVRKHERPHAAVLYEAIRREGRELFERPAASLVSSGLAAGLAVSFSFAAEAALRSGLPETGWRHLVSSLGYPLGFLAVIIGRQQLFTEDTLTAVVPWLSRRNRENLVAVLRVWGLVLLANLVGTALFAVAAAQTEVFSNEVRMAMRAISREALAHPFLNTLSRGVLAGWLIALAAWLLPGAEAGRVSVIFVLTYAIALFGFAHSIAGSSEAFFAVAAGEAPIGAYVAFLVPARPGERLGGVLLVAVLNHGQVAHRVRGNEPL